MEDHSIRIIKPRVDRAIAVTRILAESVVLLALLVIAISIPSTRSFCVEHPILVMLFILLILGDGLLSTFWSDKTSLYDIVLEGDRIYGPNSSMALAERISVDLKQIDLSISKKPSMLSTGYLVTKDRKKIVLICAGFYREDIDNLFDEIRKLTSQFIGPANTVR